jgi:hypothetical protein
MTTVDNAAPRWEILARVCSPVIRCSSTSSSPTLAHGSLSCRMYSPKMGLASCRLVVLCL